MFAAQSVLIHLASLELLFFISIFVMTVSFFFLLPNFVSYSSFTLCLLCQKEEEETEPVEIEPDEDSQWEPEEAAVTKPATYRINTWDRTVLGR